MNTEERDTIPAPAPVSSDTQVILAKLDAMAQMMVLMQGALQTLTDRVTEHDELRKEVFALAQRVANVAKHVSTNGAHDHGI